MKKLFVCIVMMLTLCVNNSSAQNVIRKGNTFSTVSSSRTKGDTLVTKYTFEDNKGIKYPIIVNKTKGTCYVWKKSAKTGRLYKYYMPKDITRTVCGELNIEYKK